MEKKSKFDEIEKSSSKPAGGLENFNIDKSKEN